jgi:MFS family permease
LPFAVNGFALAVTLVLFFAGFNLLEAALPSLVAKTAPVAEKGTAMGVFSTSQFLGIFVGGVAGGGILAHAGPAVVFMLGLVSAVVWLLIARTMASPGHLANRSYALPEPWASDASDLQSRIDDMEGVAEVRVSAIESAIYLKVDPDVFEEPALRGLLLDAPPDAHPSAAEGSTS